MWLVRILKSGDISVFTDEVKTIQLKVKDKNFDINLTDKELLKTMLRAEAGAKGGSILKSLELAKNVAEELKKDGFTIKVSHKDRVVLTLGFGANPTLSQLVTKTDAIEIHNLSELIQLVS